MPKTKAYSKTTRTPKFQHGNYPFYYGYRNPMSSYDDPRINLLNPEWISNKRCLDIGCNSGLVTIEVARRFNPKEIVGIDIDQSLIKKARKNLYLANSLRKPLASFETKKDKDQNTHNDSGNGSYSDKEQGSNYFPISMPILYGTIPVRPYTSLNGTLESEDVTNKNDNDGDDDDEWVKKVQFFMADWMNISKSKRHAKVLDQLTKDGSYDVVIAWSITKWVHLNHGDDGIRQFFQKVYDSLAPGGIFLLEPQNWDGYSKRSRISPAMKSNYDSIKLKPDQFESYLLGDVGFVRSEYLGTPETLAKGKCASDTQPSSGYYRLLIFRSTSALKYESGHT
ncbi:hypothetical protein H4219_000723 [Mycoemilia scoparia]|uniref:RNA methyltransferase n=1 Tax=Mycoemilia scoparia TaxID=417184 RepID=A0A9W8DX21_9FUNG|nr:hypothetical protein H4219_000723 [Mycoemilia scoparia]